MKKVRNFTLKRANGLISILLTILGFGASCDIGSAEYGVPSATFRVKGIVQSEVSSEAIPNIRVAMDYDTVYTDESGNFEIESTRFPNNQTLLVEFKDIDGIVNDEYQPLDTSVEFIDPEFTGDKDGWYSGETEKEITIKLKDKE